MSTAHISCPARRRPVHGLDVVRLIAAMLVVIYHLGFKAWALPGSSLRHVIDAPVTHPPGYGLTWCGWIGVQVFFVVSGAVIAYSAEGRAPDPLPGAVSPVFFLQSSSPRRSHCRWRCSCFVPRPPQP
ncbi:acyltransferase family protein [Novosphingobium panipatense]